MPVVEMPYRARISQDLALPVAYTTFAAEVVAAPVLTTVVDQTRSVTDRFDSYSTHERGQPRWPRAAALPAAPGGAQ